MSSQSDPSSGGSFFALTGGPLEILLEARFQRSQ